MKFSRPGVATLSKLINNADYAAYVGVIMEAPNVAIEESSPASPESLKRGPTVQEMHVDFLLWEELSTNRSFLQEFLKHCIGHDDLTCLDDVRHSVSDLSGEADLIVRYRNGDGERIAVLIEDKIGAAFQPRQAERYAQRGEAGIPKEWDRFVTCLVAPSNYIEKGHAFQKAVPLESIRTWIAISDNARADFRAGIVATAIDQSVRRGPKFVDETVTEFRMRYYEFLTQEAGELSMNKPGRAGPGETWFFLRHGNLPKGSSIVHKSTLGVVDLAFDRTDVGKMFGVTARLEHGMEIRQTGKSASIRLNVPSIESFESFDAKVGSVRAALTAAMRLAVFANRERPYLQQALG
jgi:hypothetical protein